MRTIRRGIGRDGLPGRGRPLRAPRGLRPIVIVAGAALCLLTGTAALAGHLDDAQTRAVVGPPVAADSPVADAQGGAPGAPAGQSVINDTAALPAAAVPAPRTLTSPLDLVAVRTGVTPATLRKISAVAGTSDTGLVEGTVVVAGHDYTIAAADPIALRGISPAPTAASNPLWAAIARGDLVATYEGRAAHLGSLGAPLAVGVAGQEVALRLGARAGFGLTGIDFVLSPARAAELGLHTLNALLVSSATQPSSDTQVAALAGAIRRVAAGTATTFTPLGTAAATTSDPTGETWISLFRQAATTCPGLPWQVLAAIGQIESDDGQNDGPSSAGAVGPMQFEPYIFAQVAVNADPGVPLSPLDAKDAVYSAARLLCLDGGASSAALPSAVFEYNHASWYVAEVLALAAEY